MTTSLKLAFGLEFRELYSRTGLIKIDGYFIEFLKNHSVVLHNQLVTARITPELLTSDQYSQIILELAPYLDDFIAKLFAINHELGELSRQHNELADIFYSKRQFIQRRVHKSYQLGDDNIDVPSTITAIEQIIGAPLTELSFAHAIKCALLEDDQEQLALFATYSNWAMFSAQGRLKHSKDVLFKPVEKLDYTQLVPLTTEIIDGVTIAQLASNKLRFRDGFKLTAEEVSLTVALNEANYCIYCHHQGKDSCSKGLKEKDGSFKKNPLGNELTGCPLEEKISEMNELKKNGICIGALAVAIIDNPCLAATGHRICNDCMKSCIYQKQEPVNIPKIESRTLADILALTWGFEIYSLLTRWNPLNLATPLPKPLTGYKVLIAGLGPAGFTLAHYLLNEGHTVIAIDGLKIEPLAPILAGNNFQPIKKIADIFKPLDQRTLAGFGGVVEYGITVRFDKNYLKVIRLLLERRENFAAFGGVRFGSSITYRSAFELGFDHIALALGSGKPNLLNLPNLLAPGVRTASDFLMALQLTGAALRHTIANLQIRMPILVIGGGLTAIDTATESLAYYPIQLEKFQERYETLCYELGAAAIRREWSVEETICADEFLAHADAIRAEKLLASVENRSPNLIFLLKSWGGAKVVYRQRLIDAPSYRLNHEEIWLAMQEGIEFVENMTPKEIILDQFGHVAGLKCIDAKQSEVFLPAKAVLIAAGTQANTILADEDPMNFSLDGKYFAALDEHGQKITPDTCAKPKQVAALMSIDEQQRAVSFFGDLHPSFSGNVVKAMASSKRGYPIISQILTKRKPSENIDHVQFIAQMAELLEARVEQVIQLTPTITELIVKAPLAARAFKPGQFYRLQNYAQNALRCGSHTILSLEGLALTGASVDIDKGCISLIVLSMGGSSDLCQYLKPGEPIVLMGPTGEPTETVTDKTVILIGGGLGNAVLFSIGRELRQKNCQVIYFAGYRKLDDRYKIKEIEMAADIIIWCCDEGELEVTRPRDKTVHGNIIEAMLSYATGRLGDVTLPLAAADRIISIGSDKMMHAVARARHSVLQPYLKDNHQGIASVNSPMQCMMKGICAQCLQLHIDPVSGTESYVYSCVIQDQDMDRINFPHLAARLSQQGLQEKLTKEWISHCLREMKLR